MLHKLSDLNLGLRLKRHEFILENIFRSLISKHAATTKSLVYNAQKSLSEKFAIYRHVSNLRMGMVDFLDKSHIILAPENHYRVNL